MGISHEEFGELLADEMEKIRQQQLIIDEHGNTNDPSLNDEKGRKEDWESSFFE